MSNENQQQPPQNQPEVTPGIPVEPEVPQPDQPYYSPSQPGAPLRTPDFVPGQPGIPVVPYAPANPEQTPPAPVGPDGAPAPVAVPDPGGPRVVGPGGRIVPAPGGGGQVDDAGKVDEGKTSERRRHEKKIEQVAPDRNPDVHDPVKKWCFEHRAQH